MVGIVIVVLLIFYAGNHPPTVFQAKLSSSF
jgi:hypothetical protein